MKIRFAHVLLSCLLLLGGGFCLRAQEAAPAPEQKLININTADEKELQKIPRVGPALSKRIIAYRAANGPFKKPEDLIKVKGIGKKTFEKMKTMITVGEEGAAAAAAEGAAAPVAE